AADIATRVVTGDLGKLSIGASASLAHAGQIVSQQSSNLGENLMRLARDIESRVDKKESYMGELHQFSEKLLTAGPVGEFYSKALGAVEGTGPQAACNGLAALIATLNDHPNAIMNHAQVVSTLCSALMADIAAGAMVRSDS
ncbi:hypothetical protein EBR57_03365, partial [bacterium]|nr:hypothetical protein [bacterium]